MHEFDSNFRFFTYSSLMVNFNPLNYLTKKRKDLACDQNLHDDSFRHFKSIVFIAMNAIYNELFIVKSHMAFLKPLESLWFEN